jgi:hypothetical protein
MKHSTGKPTKAEQARLDAIHAMPCIACEKERVVQPLRTEAHHLVDKGTRALSGGHVATIPLCKYHHRGELLDYMSGREMKFVYGPSLALHKREFKACYGTERELLAETDERLKEDAAA